MKHRIAALFVQPDGCYSGLDCVDMWDESRDARKYNGGVPVVAHPPCQLWGNLSFVNQARWGGEHNRHGNDGGCFKSALDSVNKWGGVLEHPAYTRAFSAHGLPVPVGSGWQKTLFGGWVCEVWQSAYGHRANKSTWLYYSGIEPPMTLDWSRPVGSHQIGGADQRGKENNKPVLSKNEANATPERFRDVLIDLAMASHGCT